MNLKKTQQKKKKKRYQSNRETQGDVIDCKKSERLLKESEEFNRKLIEQSLDGIWMIDSDGKIVFANERLHKMLGYENEEMLGRNFLEFIVDDERKRAWGLLFGSRRVENNVHDISFQDRSGNILHTMVSVSPNLSEDGEFLGAFAYIRDITDRKKAEEITEFLRDAATKILSFKDPEDRYQLLLDKLLKLTNSRYGFIGYIDDNTGHLIIPTLTKSVWDICNVKNKDIVFKEFSGLMGWVLENKRSLICNDRHQDKRSKPLPEGHIKIDNLLCVPCIIEDKIAGLVALANKPGSYTEDDLHIVERFAQLVVLTISAHLAEEERKKIREEIEYLNKQLLSIIEVDQQIASTLELARLLSKVCDLVIEMLDLKMAWVGLVEKGSREVRPTAWSGNEDGYLRSIRVTYDNSKYGKGPTGTAVREKRVVIQNDIRTDPEFKPWREEALKRGYLSSAAVPLIYRGNILGTINVYSEKPGFFNDSVVKVLKNYANRVAIAIENARLYEETKKAYEGLKAIDSLKDEMLSNVSHELKTPVTIISGFLELLLSSEFGEITEEQKNVIETIKRNTNRLIRLIDNLVTLRGLEFHEISLEKEIIFPNEMLEEVIEETKNFVEQKNLSLEYDIQDNLPLIRGDKYKIVQVMFNLIDNAIKFTPPGGKIRITAKRLKKNIKISVEDTGIGISEEEIPNIFKRFYQIDGSTTRKYSGTGIGLTISKDIVEAHGGKIFAKNKHSNGCIFSFILPVFEKKSRQEPRMITR